MDITVGERETLGTVRGRARQPGKTNSTSRAEPGRQLGLDLGGMIARTVVPRLHEALRDRLAEDQHPLVAERTKGGNLDRHVDSLADRLLRNDVDGACTRIDAIRACGRQLDKIYLDLLLPTAVRLNRLGADDVCGSAEATIAFCNLQIVLRRYASEFIAEGDQPCSGHRALLASPPVRGDGAALHVFGLLFMSDFFRRAGWDAWTERSLSSAAFRDVVSSQWFDPIEVLATSDDDLEEITTGVAFIRRESPNRQIGVIACGQVFSQNPHLVQLVGADCSANDPLASLDQARHLAAGQDRRRRLS